MDPLNRFLISNVLCGLLVGLFLVIGARFQSQGDPLVERLFRGTVTGMFIVLVVLQLIAGLGVLSAALPWLGLAAVLMVIRCGAGIRSIRLKGRLAVLLLAVLICLPYWLQSSLPNGEWDTAAYHLPQASALLDHGLSLTDPGFLHGTYPAGGSVFAAIFVRAGLPDGIALFHLAVNLLVVTGTYCLGARFGGTGVGTWAAALLVANPLFMELGLDARVDNLVALGIVGAALGVVTGVHEGRRDSLLFAAACLGLALSAKYTALAFGIPFVILIPVVVSRFGPRATLRLATAALILMSLGGGVWFVRNAIEVGEPMPLGTFGGNDRVRLEAAFEERLQDPSHGDEFDRMMSTRAERKIPGHAFDLIDMVHRPHLYGRRPLHFYNPLILLMLAAPFVLRGRAGLWLFLSIAVPWIVLGSQSSLVRYLVPGLPAACVLAAAVSAAWSGILRTAFRWAIVLSIGLLIGRQLEKPSFGLVVPHLAGSIPTDEVRERIGLNDIRSMTGVRGFFNGLADSDDLRPEDAVYMVGEAKIHDLPLRVLPDQSVDLYRLNRDLLAADMDVDRLRRSLVDRGVRYILVNRDYLQWARDNSVLDERLHLLGSWTLRDLLSGHSRLVSESDGIEIHSITHEKTTRRVVFGDSK